MATKRQKAFAKIVQRKVRNGEKSGSLGAIAEEAGYSPTTADHPKDKIIETKGFKEALAVKIKEDDAVDLQVGLMKLEQLDSFPFELACEDEKITDVIKEMGCRLLSIAPVPIIGKKIAYFAAPNGKIRVQGMDMYHKVQGNYAPTQHKVKFDDIDEMEEPELDEHLADTEPMAARYKKFSKEKKLERARARKK